MSNSSHKKKAYLLGLGLDGDDGHTRVTRGDNFLLAGGSEDTHQRMTEGVIKMNEHLSQKGKTLDSVGKEELLDIAHKSGLGINPRRN